MLQFGQYIYILTVLCIYACLNREQKSEAEDDTQLLFQDSSSRTAGASS